MVEVKTNKKKLMVCALATIMVATAIMLPFMHQETEDSDANVFNDIEDAFNCLTAKSGWTKEYFGVTLELGTFAGLPYVYVDDVGSSNDNDATSVVNTINAVINAIYALEPSISSGISFSSSYFQRMCEVAAAETWYAGGTIDNDIILLNSQTCDFVTKDIINYTTPISSEFDYSLNDSSLGHSFKVGTYTITPKSIDVSDDDIISFGMGTNVTSSSNNKVYIYPGENDNYGYIWVYGGSATITDSDGHTYTLDQGRNDLSGLDKGIYTLQSGRTYVGSLYSSYDSGAATVYPACVINGSSGYCYVLETAHGNSTIFYNGSATTTTSEVTYKIADRDSTSECSVSKVFDIMRNLMAANQELINDSLTSAQTAWMVFDTAGESSVFVSPSSLIPNLKNLDFTSSQAYLIYMSALQQMSEKFKTTSDKFEASDVLISEDSLDLVCYGTIYTVSQGGSRTALATDIYFTPMCYERDQSILIGETPFLQPGLAMTWVSDGNGGFTPGKLITLQSSMVLSISAMIYRGTEYTNVGDGVTLQVKSLPELEGYDPEPWEPSKQSNVDWIIILAICGIILIALGCIFEFNKVLIIFGFVCITIAIIWYFLPEIENFIGSLNPFIISSEGGP